MIYAKESSYNKWENAWKTAPKAVKLLRLFIDEQIDDKAALSQVKKHVLKTTSINDIESLCLY